LGNVSNKLLKTSFLGNKIRLVEPTLEDVENMVQSLNDYLANNKNHNSIEIEIIKSFINFVQNHDGVNGFEIY